MIIKSSTPKIYYLPLQHLKDGFLAGSQITSEWKIKCMVYFTYIFREAINCEKKDFFVKPLHKMVTPPPSPFYEVPINFFFSSIFLAKKRDDLEGCLKGVDGCFKCVAGGCLKCVWWVFGKIK